MMRMWVIAITKKYPKIITAELVGHPRGLKYRHYDDTVKPIDIENPEKYIPISRFIEYLEIIHKIKSVRAGWVEHRIRCMFPPSRIWIHEDSTGDFK